LFLMLACRHPGSAKGTGRSSWLIAILLPAKGQPKVVQKTFIDVDRGE
jgi:hypothetical protein